MLFTLLEYQSAIKSATQIIIGPIAQLAEHSTENASVRSSTLRWATTLIHWHVLKNMLFLYFLSYGSSLSYVTFSADNWFDEYF